MKTALQLTTLPVLPYDPRLYAEVVKGSFDDLSKLYSDILSKQNITLCESKFVHEDKLD